ncbi:MAG: SDR family oxidoreductase [Polyangiaceae bacterium]|nr:SDR family oxidoreductase [Polyangiaceae bacterium]
MCEIDGRVIVITGAAGNLGVATAKLFASRGARLVLLDRDDGRVREELDDIAKSDKHRVVAVDVTDEGSVSSAVASAEKALGPTQALVCTVGGFKGGVDVMGTSWSDWELMLSINLRATVACSRAVLPGMLNRKSGSIVHLASLAALGPGPGQAAYSASKSAVLSFSETLAAETKASGVRVNAVLPGTMNTPQNRSWMSDADVKKAVDPTAVADVIAFLVSNAARAVTGAAIRVTGQQ